MALSHSPSIVRDGLVLCLDAANTKSYSGSGATWNDLSGNSNNGTLTGSPTFSFPYISFNGSAKRATITPVSGSQITAVVWYRRVEEESASNWRTILATTSTNFHHLISQQTSRNIGIWDGGFRDFGYNPPLDSKFHSYCVVYTSGASASLYVDGAFISTVSTSLDLTIRTIGSIGNWSSGNYWAGQISSVSIYSRALSAVEIKQNFDALRGRYGL